MSKQKKTKKPKILCAMCEYCPRIIVKEDEPNGEYYVKDGKRMCMICRVVKGSKFEQEIKASKPRMEEDLKQLNEVFDQEETERIIAIAAEAQAQVEKQEISKNLSK